MKTKKKLVVMGMSLLILGGMLTTVSAYTSVSGTGYQTVSIADIPGGGRSKYDLNKGSKKATTGYFATFKKTYSQAALGNFGELVDEYKNSKSDTVGMPLNSAVCAEENSCSKGNVYFLGVSSSSIEPSNTCDVTVKFSADELN